MACDSRTRAVRDRLRANVSTKLNLVSRYEDTGEKIEGPSIFIPVCSRQKAHENVIMRACVRNRQEWQR